MRNKQLLEGRMRKGWKKGWAVTQCSNRNKFRLCVRCATLRPICLVQEKHLAYASALGNVNSLNNFRIHL